MTKEKRGDGSFTGCIADGDVETARQIAEALFKGPPDQDGDDGSKREESTTTPPNYSAGTIGAEIKTAA